MSIPSITPNSPIVIEQTQINQDTILPHTSIFDSFFEEMCSSIFNEEDLDTSAAIFITNEKLTGFLLQESFKGLSLKLKQKCLDLQFESHMQKDIKHLFEKTYATALRHSNYWHTFKEYPAKLKPFLKLANKNDILLVISTAEKALIPLKNGHSLNDIITKQKVVSDIQERLTPIRDLLEFSDPEENEKIQFLTPHIAEELFPRDTNHLLRTFQNDFKKLVDEVQRLKEIIKQAGQILKQVVLFNHALTIQRSEKYSKPQKITETSQGEKIYQQHALTVLTECRAILYSRFIQELKTAKTSSALFKCVSHVYSEKKLQSTLKNLLLEREEIICQNLNIDFMMSCFEYHYKNSPLDLEIIAVWLLNKIHPKIQEELVKMPNTTTLQNCFSITLNTMSITFTTLDRCLQ